MCLHNIANCSGCYPYMSKLIQSVVGEFHLEEGHRLLHPVGSRGGGVWVDVGSARGLGLGLAGYFPLLIIPLQKDTGDGEKKGGGVIRCETTGESDQACHRGLQNCICTRNKTSTSYRLNQSLSYHQILASAC